MNDVIEVPLTRGLVAIIDASDADLVLPIKWCARLHHGNQYAWTGGLKHQDGRQRWSLLHKFLTGWPRTDHIDGNGLNNRRSNLRPATNSQNIMNSHKRRGQKSVYRGVGLYRRPNGYTRWRATIKPPGSTCGYSFGYFLSQEEAARAYDDAARELFGEFARLNFPLPGEQSAIRK